MRSVRTTTFNCGSMLTLEKMREIVEKTKDLPKDARIEPRITTGQRDEPNYTFIIEQTL